MHISKVSIGDKKINVSQPSAKDQMEGANLIFPSLITSKIKFDRSDYDKKLIMMLLITIPNDINEKIGKLLLQKAYLAGTEIPVDIETFKGNILQYVELLSELIQDNYADVFKWLPSLEKETSVSP